MAKNRSIVKLISTIKLVIGIFTVLLGILLMMPHMLEDSLSLFYESIEYRMISRDIYTMAIVTLIRGIAMILTAVIGFLSISNPKKIDAIRYMSLILIFIQISDVIYSLIFSFSFNDLFVLLAAIALNVLLYHSATRFKKEYLEKESAEEKTADPGDQALIDDGSVL